MRLTSQVSSSGGGLPGRPGLEKVQDARYLCGEICDDRWCAYWDRWRLRLRAANANHRLRASSKQPPISEKIPTTPATTMPAQKKGLCISWGDERE